MIAITFQYTNELKTVAFIDAQKAFLGTSEKSLIYMSPGFHNKNSFFKNWEYETTVDKYKWKFTC